ncbi:CvpA family protein [Rickettsia prowazekii]|uniref:Colicin V production membrane protein n=2 Tax=Rickettsia prowazekii TaxID=782 RepID=Q9ZEB2_RICPR|nr:CvpA family protein [Rickettsia prowazekii]ADE29544.1 Putative colicin V production membrane protein [Rickettsia prowazekii str. Rp22]AFE48863.1 hypothetical protein M9W_00150 [Rickettsia prowazekii str. Chernikova]AFE49708.1 hypothetical protein M9Y_00150 [Rickettsia prowazekii str. Katsinyian]AFE50552.1 hypothetical protein MA1_00150 [Rickettsia prowazekii str. BuV67-CWPP]AFE51394.1 hypothetical protein MA3_00155 [Rickettsia prowazekii str. Dachau]
MITFFDITIFAIITLFSFFGLYQGIVGFLTRILGFIASIMLGYFLYPYISAQIVKYIENEVISIIITSVISYVISLILCVFIVYKFLAIISFMRNGFIDRFLGLLVGFVLGSTISLVLFLITMIFTSENYFQSKSLKDFVISSKQNKYGGVLKFSVTTDYLDELSRKIIVIMLNNIFGSIEIFKNKDFKNFLKKSNSLNDIEDVFSKELQDELSNIDD